MWIVYRKYSLCIKKIVDKYLGRYIEDIYKIVFFLKDSFKGIFFWEIVYFMLFIGKNKRISIFIFLRVNKSVICFGNFSYFFGNFLT